MCEILQNLQLKRTVVINTPNQQAQQWEAGRWQAAVWHLAEATVTARGERWAWGSILPSVDKGRGTDSLPLDSGQTLSPIIKHSITTRNWTSSGLEGQGGYFSWSPPPGNLNSMLNIFNSALDSAGEGAAVGNSGRGTTALLNYVKAPWPQTQFLGLPQLQHRNGNQGRFFSDPMLEYKTHVLKREMSWKNTC